MTNEPSPRPWRFEDDQYIPAIVDANGVLVAFPSSPDNGKAATDNAALIVAAVNERDRLRDQLAAALRLADIVRRLVGYCEAVTVYSPPVVEARGSDGTHEDYNGAELLREARAALEEGGRS